MSSSIADFHLKNGLRVYLVENHFSKTVTFQCWVKAGSLYEDKNEKGIAHLIEHMLFKGTGKRGVGEIAKLVESCGGDINAFTTFDSTVFYLSMTSDHWKVGVEVLADAIANSLIDEQELLNEKEVVFEEIRRSDDSPGSLLGRQIFADVYAGTEASRPITGTIESVAGISRDQILAFLKKWYIPKNMVFIGVGDFEIEEISKAVVKEFDSMPSTEVPSFILPQRVHPKGLRISLIRGDYQQQRLELAFCGPSLENVDSIYLDIVAFILGVGDSSRLNQRMRETEGIAANVGCSSYTPKFGGVFEMSVIPNAGSLLQCVEVLAQELQKLKKFGVTIAEIERAVANLRSSRSFQEETVGGQARNIGSALQTSMGIHYDDAYELVASRSTTQQIQAAIHRWFDTENLNIVGLVSDGDSLGEKDIEKAFKKGLKESTNRKVENPVEKSKPDTYVPQICELKPGLKLVYRRNPFSKVVGLVGVTSGGLRAESVKDIGIHSAISSLLGTATQNHSYDEILDLVEGVGASLSGFSGKDSIGVKLLCLADQFDSLLPLWGSVIEESLFPEQQWMANLREINDIIRSEDDNPANIAVRAFQKAIYGDHPYSFPIYGTQNVVQQFTSSNLLSAFNSKKKKFPWVISFVGPLEFEEVVTKLTSLLNNFSMGELQNRASLVEMEPLQVFDSEVRIHKDREQTHILLGGRGITWGDPRRPALDVLGAILGGSGGRLFTELRDRQSLAYTVAPIISYGCDPGGIGAYIACAPEKSEIALAALEKQLKILCESKVSEVELQRAKNYLLGSHETDMQRTDSQAMTMALMEVYGFGYNDFITYPNRLKEVDSDALLTVAQELIGDSKFVRVLVGKEFRQNK